MSGLTGGGLYDGVGAGAGATAVVPPDEMRIAALRGSHSTAAPSAFAAASNGTYTMSSRIKGRALTSTLLTFTTFSDGSHLNDTFMAVARDNAGRYATPSSRMGLTPIFMPST